VIVLVVNVYDLLYKRRNQITVLGFEFRASCLLSRGLYHLNYSTSPSNEILKVTLYLIRDTEVVRVPYVHILSHTFSFLSINQMPRHGSCSQVVLKQCGWGIRK
jgi:hypothetical protein